MALAHSLLEGITEDHVLEIGGAVGGRRCGEADLYAIEVVDGLAPDREFSAGVATVTLVGDDYVEGVDRNVKRLSLGLFTRRLVLFEDRLLTKEVDRHPLDRA